MGRPPALALHPEVHVSRAHTHAHTRMHGSPRPGTRAPRTPWGGASQKPGSPHSILPNHHPIHLNCCPKKQLKAPQTQAPWHEGSRQAELGLLQRLPGNKRPENAVGSLAETDRATGLPVTWWCWPDLAHWPEDSANRCPALGSGPQHCPAQPSCPRPSWSPPPGPGDNRTGTGSLSCRVPACREGGIFSFPSWKPTGSRPTVAQQCCLQVRATSPSSTDSLEEEQPPQRAVWLAHPPTCSGPHAQPGHETSWWTPVLPPCKAYCLGYRPTHAPIYLIRGP